MNTPQDASDTQINELFDLEEAEKRQELILRRRREFKSDYDFSPYTGYCDCGHDLVAENGKRYVQAWITGCRRCGRSYVD